MASGRIVILGAEGYVGSVLVKVCRELGLRTISVDAGWFCTIESAAHNHQDIRDLDQSFFQPGDIVVNLAAVSNDPIGEEFESATIAINRDSAVRVAELARERGAALYIFASSASVYGTVESGLVANEHFPLQPQTAYAKSKADAEILLQDVSEKDFYVVSMRFATALGNSRNLRLDLAVNEFTANAIWDGDVGINSSGSAYRPFIAVHDMVSAILMVIEENGKLVHPFTVFNVVAEGWNFRVIEVANKVADSLGAQILQGAGVSEDRRNYSMDGSLWRDTFPAWKPKLSFEECILDLAQTISSYPDKSWRPGGTNSPHVRRLESLKNSISLGRLTPDLRLQRGASRAISD